MHQCREAEERKAGGGAIEGRRSTFTQTQCLSPDRNQHLTDCSMESGKKRQIEEETPKKWDEREEQRGGKEGEGMSDLCLTLDKSRGKRDWF